jgi:LPPG:FO 2-phospho-L-lactate transferase
MSSKVVALCGGVGGAKLAVGLAQVVPPEDLTVVVNTGDDFQHLGLHISPDVDTVLYTLAGVSDTDRGWGLANESWSFMDALTRLGGEDWFRLGDGDLATHVLRTERLRAGRSLSSITNDLARALGVGPTVLPMSDDSVRTVLDTDVGRLDFQDYFVRRQARPAVKSIAYEGAESALPSAEVLKALSDPSLKLIVICPSNPWLSIAPMLAIPAFKAAIVKSGRPVIAVSPLVGGTAVKGPTAKVMKELQYEVSAQAVASYYGSLVTAHVVDESHAREAAAMRSSGFEVDVGHTLMTDAASKRMLAAAIVELGLRLAQSRT